MSRDVKTQLKEARNAIKDKEFNVAVKICKEILKADGKNYMALVLMGAAYQDSDKEEAAQCLKKACDCSKDPTVALQGLLNCASPADLPDIIRKLLKLTPDRCEELHKKLYSTAQNSEQLEVCIEIFNCEATTDGVKEARISSAYDYLAQLYIQSPNEFKDKWTEIIEKSLEYKLEQPEVPGEYSKLYLKLLYKLKKFEKLVEKSLKIIEATPTDLNALEWICKVYSEKYTKPLFDGIDMSMPFENLLKIQPSSILGLIAKGIWLYKQNDFAKSKEILENANNIKPNWSICLKLLIELNFKVGAFIQTEIYIRELTGLKNVTLNDELLLCKSLIEQNDRTKLSEAIQLCRDLIPQTSGDQQTEMIFFLAKALIYNEQPVPAEKTLEKLKALGKLDYHTIGTALKYRIDGAYGESIKTLEANSIESTEYYLELGKNYFAIENFNKTLVSLLKATKLEPYNSECFFWLGKLYDRINDVQRAQKCYEKSLTLNLNNKSCVIQLTTIYRKNNEFKSNHVLLENLTNIAVGKEKVWSLRQLGLNYLSLMNHNEAINIFRLALRYDSADIPSWEGLADSYLARGSFNSALKVYQKVIELDPTSLYPQLQVANINTTLMMFTEAIEQYEKILETDPEYFPALKGIAETHLGYAKKLFVQQIFGRSRDQAQKSVDYILRAIQLKSYIACVWRQLAFSLGFIATNPLKYAFVQVPGALAGVEETETILSGDKIFDLSSKCYCRAIKIDPNDSLLWYDLAFNYYNHALRSLADDKLRYLKLSLETIKYAIKINSMRWMFWNLMGCIVTTKQLNNWPLAQHCFIKAVTIDKKSYTSWTNLGVLYLLQNEIKLSNKAFSMAQQSEPNYVNAWAGQATVAELISEEEEALDLFRHCTQLGFHPESAIGYAHWVCSILSDKKKIKKPHYQYAIESMYAVPVALDSIDWYCKYDGVNANVQSLCFLGYLNYQEQLWGPAIKAFTLALENAEGSVKDNLLCNLGYSLLKVNNPKEAIKAFNAVTEASYKSTIGLALSYFKAKQYEDSYNLYDSALQWLATNDVEKSMILIAMSSMVYDFQGAKDAKTVLFQCISLASPPIEGLYSACALGILHQDTQLSELVLQELKKYEHNQNFCHHIAFLKSQIILINENKKAALLYLISQIHLMPNNAQLRKVFVKFLLKNFTDDEKYAKSASRIAQSSIILDLKNMKRNTSIDAAKSLAMASDAMKSVDQKERKILAQKAIHMNPTCKEAWSALIRCR